MDMYIWTDLFITAFNNTDMTVLCKYITPQWRCVRDMASQITGNSTVVFRLNKGGIKAQHYWPFGRGIHRQSIIIIVIIIIIINIIILIIIIIIVNIIVIINIIITPPLSGRRVSGTQAQWWGLEQATT